MYKKEYLAGFPYTLNTPKLTCAKAQELWYNWPENLIRRCLLSTLRAAGLPACPLWREVREGLQSRPLTYGWLEA